MALHLRWGNRSDPIVAGSSSSSPKAKVEERLKKKTSAAEVGRKSNAPTVGSDSKPKSKIPVATKKRSATGQDGGGSRKKRQKLTNLAKK